MCNLKWNWDRSAKLCACACFVSDAHNHDFDMTYGEKKNSIELLATILSVTVCFCAEDGSQCFDVLTQVQPRWHTLTSTKNVPGAFFHKGYVFRTLPDQPFQRVPRAKKNWWFCAKYCAKYTLKWRFRAHYSQILGSTQLTILASCETYTIHYFESSADGRIHWRTHAPLQSWWVFNSAIRA